MVHFEVRIAYGSCFGMMYGVEINL